MVVDDIKRDLSAKRDSIKAKELARFFKTGKGEYAEGDMFLGVPVPEIRKIIKPYTASATWRDIDELLESSIHEHRFAGLVILVKLFEKGAPEVKAYIANYYLDMTKYINNWDLVDVSAPKIVGKWWLEQKQFDAPLDLAESEDLWEHRIAILATFAFIRENHFETTLQIAEKFLKHEHDLIHKATGWMLREVGKRDERVLIEFLEKYAKDMPRTMLRYAIERLSPSQKEKFMKKA
jgi:3-methyladenine DNA glycosylase AlkD